MSGTLSGGRYQTKDIIASVIQQTHSTQKSFSEREQNVGLRSKQMESLNSGSVQKNKKYSNKDQVTSVDMSSGKHFKFHEMIGQHGSTQI